jgi:hypothetical protein
MEKKITNKLREEKIKEKEKKRFIKDKGTQLT